MGEFPSSSPPPAEGNKRERQTELQGALFVTLQNKLFRRNLLEAIAGGHARAYLEDFLRYLQNKTDPEKQFNQATLDSLKNQMLSLFSEMRTLLVEEEKESTPVLAQLAGKKKREDERREFLRQMEEKYGEPFRKKYDEYKKLRKECEDLAGREYFVEANYFYDAHPKSGPDFYYERELREENGENFCKLNRLRSVVHMDELEAKKLARENPDLMVPSLRGALFNAYFTRLPEINEHLALLEGAEDERMREYVEEELQRLKDRSSFWRNVPNEAIAQLTKDLQNLGLYEEMRFKAS